MLARSRALRESELGLWREPLTTEGGATRVLSEKGPVGIIISRTGHRAAFAFFEPEGDRLRLRVGLASLVEDGDLGPMTDVLDPRDGVIEARWGERDESFFYRRTLDGVTNIWLGAVRGEMHPITDFESGISRPLTESGDVRGRCTRVLRGRPRSFIGLNTLAAEKIDT